MNNPLASIIVRTKNEEKWIGDCLDAISKQRYPNFEIILVDNLSTDKTVEKAMDFGVKLVEIERFRPGLAINDGIRASKGDLLVCLSGHCIPSNDNWLENLLKPLLDEELIAGVYGRQLPMNFSSALDKRDLAIVFGLDSRVQKRDGFFHNANSAFRRSDWEDLPFDEEATNIEDRLWGNIMVSKGRHLFYEPSAAVFHFHGIHQGSSEERAKKIIRIIESTEGIESQGTLRPEGRNIVGLIPFNGAHSKLNIFLIHRALAHLRESKYIKTIILGVTDQNLVAEFCQEDDLVVYTRDEIDEKEKSYSLAEVCRDLVDKFEIENGVVDSVLMTAPKNALRKADMIDKILDELYFGGYDSVFPAFRDKRDLFGVASDSITAAPETFDIPRTEKNEYALAAVNGLGLAIRGNCLREGKLKSMSSAAHNVSSQVAAIEITEPEFEFASAGSLISWFDSQADG